MTIKKKPPLKIRNSKGEIYLSCPFIDKVLEKISSLSSLNIIPPEDIIEINQNLEKIREINDALRTYLSFLKTITIEPIREIKINHEEPYNFSAVMKQIKIKFPQHKNEIDEIVKTYY